MREAADMQRQVGDDIELAWSLGQLGLVEAGYGNAAAATALYEEMLSISAGLDYPAAEAWARCGLGQVCFEAQDLANARLHFESAVAAHRRLGMPATVEWSFAGLARTLLAQDDAPTARELLSEALSSLMASGGSASPWMWHHFAFVCLAEGRPADAAVLLSAATEARTRTGVHLGHLSLFAQTEFDAAVAAAKAALGPSFDHHWARGMEMATAEVDAIAHEPPSSAEALG
jgi:tetratricopeptide (TPR) repeat protein